MVFEGSWADGKKSAVSSIAFSRLLLLSSACGTGSSSRREGACGKRGSVSPTNLHPTSLTLGTAHMFLICVCVLLAPLHSLPRPPALDRAVAPPPVHMLWCQRSLRSVHTVPGHRATIFFLHSVLEQLLQTEPYTCTHTCIHTNAHTHTRINAHPCSIGWGQHLLPEPAAAVAVGEVQSTLQHLALQKGCATLANLAHLPFLRPGRGRA